MVNEEEKLPITTEVQESIEPGEKNNENNGVEMETEAGEGEINEANNVATEAVQNLEAESGKKLSSLLPEAEAAGVDSTGVAENIKTLNGEAEENLNTFRRELADRKKPDGKENKPGPTNLEINDKINGLKTMKEAGVGIGGYVETLGFVQTCATKGIKGLDETNQKILENTYPNWNQADFVQLLYGIAKFDTENEDIQNATKETKDRLKFDQGQLVKREHAKQLLDAKEGLVKEVADLKNEYEALSYDLIGRVSNLENKKIIEEDSKIADSYKKTETELAGTLASVKGFENVSKKIASGQELNSLRKKIEEKLQEASFLQVGLKKTLKKALDIIDANTDSIKVEESVAKDRQERKTQIQAIEKRLTAIEEQVSQSEILNNADDILLNLSYLDPKQLEFNKTRNWAWDIREARQSSEPNAINNVRSDGAGVYYKNLNRTPE